MAVDSLQKQPARVRGQPLQEGPVGQSGGGVPPGVRNEATFAAQALFDSEACGGTKPDLALIKQVQQVPTPVLEGPVRLCRDLEHGDYRVVESSCLPILQLFFSLKFGCKKQQQQLEAPRATVCEGAVRQCYRPT
jgi:hypothetical protein